MEGGGGDWHGETTGHRRQHEAACYGFVVTGHKCCGEKRKVDHAGGLGQVVVLNAMVGGLIIKGDIWPWPGSSAGKRGSSRCTKVVGSTPGQGTYKNQAKNAPVGGTANPCLPLSAPSFLSLSKINKSK